MAIVEVLVPQMGEGLQEVQIVAFQKQPGDFVKRDETIYSMETDKANLEVESPFEGVLQQWLVEEGDTLAIGAPVARIETERAMASGDVLAREEAPAASASIHAAPSRDAAISPRTRAYCREQGISDDEMARIPIASGKLMPADVDAYLTTKTGNGGGQAPPAFVERALSPQQRTFNYRLKRSVQVVIPAVAKRPMEWGNIRRFADGCRERGDAAQPSAFQVFAFCVVQAAKEHPRFRSTLIGEDVLREYEHVNVGIAVGLPDGLLTTAVVKHADALPFDQFVRTAQERIERARGGEDQADESTQLLLTYMGPYEITDAIPVLVAPAAAVLFVGATFLQNGTSLVNLVVTFDHRLIQGIEAAQFLRTIVEKAAQVETLCGRG